MWSSWASLFEIFGRTNQNEFLDEQFRVQDGDVRRTTDEIICTRWNIMESVVANKGDGRIAKDGFENITDHFNVDRA